MTFAAGHSAGLASLSCMTEETPSACRPWVGTEMIRGCVSDCLADQECLGMEIGLAGGPGRRTVDSNIGRTSGHKVGYDGRSSLES